jgi:hypothetical protein
VSDADGQTHEPGAEELLRRAAETGFGSSYAGISHGNTRTVGSPDRCQCGKPIFK